MEQPAIFLKKHNAGYVLNLQEIDEIVLDPNSMRLKRLRFKNGIEWAKGFFKSGGDLSKDGSLGEISHSAVELLFLSEFISKRWEDIESCINVWGSSCEKETSKNTE